MKPTKKQKAICALLDKIDEEGLDYVVYGYDSLKLMKKIDDEDLTAIIEVFDEAMQRLDAKLMEMEEQVQPFREDLMEF